jgi:hypothetical protein
MKDKLSLISYEFTVFWMFPLPQRGEGHGIAFLCSYSSLNKKKKPPK